MDVAMQNMRQAFEYLGMAIGRFFEDNQIQRDYEKLKEMIKQLEQQRIEYENDSWMWLWRKCGGVFYGGNKACFAGTHHSFGSKIGLGRQRSSLPGKRKATLGAEEVEREEG